VIEAKRDFVRIGITAPEDISINRKEIYLSKLAESKEEKD